MEPDDGVLHLQPLTCDCPPLIAAILFVAEHLRINAITKVAQQVSYAHRPLVAFALGPFHQHDHLSPWHSFRTDRQRVTARTVGMCYRPQRRRKCFPTDRFVHDRCPHMRG